MGGSQKRKRQQTFGKIEVKEEGVISFSHSDTQAQFTIPCHEWICSPSNKLKAQLQADFCLPLRCITLPDELRRIYPSDSFGAFIPMACMGGFAILCRTRRLGKRQRQSYRAMWLLFRFARRMGEFFRNAFAYSRDLYIAKS